MMCSTDTRPSLEKCLFFLHFIVESIIHKKITWKIYYAFVKWCRNEHDIHPWRNTDARPSTTYKMTLSNLLFAYHAFQCAQIPTSPTLVSTVPTTPETGALGEELGGQRSLSPKSSNSSFDTNETGNSQLLRRSRDRSKPVNLLKSRSRIGSAERHTDGEDKLEGPITCHHVLC